MIRAIRVCILPLLAAGVVYLVPPWGAADVADLVALFLAMFVVELFVLRLPRGDSLSLSAPLSVVAIVFFGPLEALAISILGRLASSRFTSDDQRDWFGGIEARTAAISMGSLVAWPLALGPRGETSWTALGVGMTVLTTELIYSQIVSMRTSEFAFFSLLSGNARLQAPLLLAQLSVCALAIVIYVPMRAWSLVITCVLLLLIRQSYALLLEVREAYRSTVSLLIDAAERGDESRRGHAERVSSIARGVGRMLGVGSAEMERLSYAALLHDVDLVGVDSGFDEELERHAGLVIQDIDFLGGVVPILCLCDGRVPVGPLCEDHLRDAFIVAVASDMDEIANRNDAGAVPRVIGRVPAGIRRSVMDAVARLGYTCPGLDD